MDFREKLIECANVLDEHKAENTVVLNLQGLSSISDYFLIASASNSRQAISLADYAEEYFEKEGLNIHHKEGVQGGDWIVLDYIDFLIHIFNGEKREYYNLDKVWSQAEKIYG